MQITKRASRKISVGSFYIKILTLNLTNKHTNIIRILDIYLIDSNFWGFFFE